MRRKHRQPEENSIESIITEEPMPDDAVLPAEEQAVTETAPPAAAAGPDITPRETPPEADAVTLLQQALEEQKRLAGENLDKALRAQAELDNMRKRTARDIENAHKYGLERFVAELLPVMDSMEMGIAAFNDVNDIKSLKEGMELTLKMFVASLDKFGVKIIDPLGEKFNPERHEAVSLQLEEGTEPGMVISVMQKGYELNGRLVRPAMVVVSR